MAGRFLIIDMSGDVPQLVSTDDVLPAALVQILGDIRQQLGVIMMNQAAGQAQINDLAAAISTVADHVSSATAGLAQWIAEHQGTIDLTGAQAALASLQAADGGLSAIVPQAPVATPLPEPIPDPGPPSPDLPPPTADPVPVDPSLLPPDQAPPEEPLPS